MESQCTEVNEIFFSYFSCFSILARSRFGTLNGSIIGLIGLYCCIMEALDWLEMNTLPEVGKPVFADARDKIVFMFCIEE